MNRLYVKAAFALLAGVVLLGRAAAGEQEVRAFAISVDGKPAGSYRMAIARQDDGTVTLDASSECVVKFLLVTAYSYTYTGHEVWKDEQLQSFASHGKENGKAFQISARLEGGALHVQANGKERTVGASAWPTSIWQLPTARAECLASPGKVVPLAYLGSDTGDEAEGGLQFVGNETVQAAGQAIPCGHYRVMKPAVHDAWYDASGRLVRDVWMSGSHRSEVMLTGIQR
jgi:hypothetical protein